MLLNEGLEESNSTLSSCNNSIARELKEKTLKAESAERARVWYPRMEKVNNSITIVYKYVDGLKKGVLNGVPITKEKAFELHNRLQTLKTILLDIYPGMTDTFGGKLVFTSQQFDTLENHTGFYNTFFKNNSQAAVITILTKFQNNLRITQNKLTAFCNNQVTSFDGDSFYTSYSAIISQNVMHVRQGDSVEIKAGLGQFSKKGKPEFKINGVLLNINEDGYVIYKTRASGKAGKRYVPVELTFTDGLGGKQTKRVVVEYTIE